MRQSSPGINIQDFLELIPGNGSDVQGQRRLLSINRTVNTQKARVPKTSKVVENVSPHFFFNFNLFRRDAYHQGVLKHVPSELPD